MKGFKTSTEAWKLCDKLNRERFTIKGPLDYGVWGGHEVYHVVHLPSKKGVSPDGKHYDIPGLRRKRR